MCLEEIRSSNNVKKTKLFLKLYTSLGIEVIT